MDGTLAPLADLCDIAERHDASLIVDEAHGTGVLGERGRGACEWSGVTERVAVRTGTLSKAIGALGGFVAGPRELTEYLWNHARTQMFSTALPPAVCAAATAAIRAIESGPHRRQHLAALTARLRERLREAGQNMNVSLETPFEIGPRLLGGEGGSDCVPIVPVILGEPERAIRIGSELERRGFAVGVIRPPTVPRATARLRISLSAVHDADSVDQLAEHVIEVCQT
jgi:7-keto-8-aminopelargonate synthetase-like enzyme